MSEPLRGRLVHAIPGRVRVKLSATSLNDGSVEQLQRGLLAMPGVEDVRISARSGSVVVRFDRERLDVAGLLEQARAAHVLAADLSDLGRVPEKSMPISLTAVGIKRTFHEVDSRLLEVTRGRWDLRSAVPAAFALLAVRQIVRNAGNLTSVPWYALAWYAFDSFWKLNAEQRGDPPADRQPSRDGAS